MKTPATTTSVGIREFRAALAGYIDGDAPVTVTRHGQAVGRFVPLRRPSTADVPRLQEAAVRFRAEMPWSDAGVDEVVVDFDALGRGTSRSAPGDV